MHKGTISFANRAAADADANNISVKLILKTSAPFENWHN